MEQLVSTLTHFSKAKENNCSVTADLLVVHEMRGKKFIKKTFPTSLISVTLKSSVSVRQPSLIPMRLKSPIAIRLKSQIDMRPNFPLTVKLKSLIPMR